MKITVDRTLDAEGNLVFTITCKEPKCPHLIQEDFDRIKKIKSLMVESSKTCGLKMDYIEEAVDNIRENFFSQIKRVLTRVIENDLNTKIIPMQAEIYRWIIDAQDDMVKDWMSSYDPQRAKYYFDNDMDIGS